MVTMTTSTHGFSMRDLNQRINLGYPQNSLACSRSRLNTLWTTVITLVIVSSGKIRSVGADAVFCCAMSEIFFTSTGTMSCLAEFRKKGEEERRNLIDDFETDQIVESS